MPPWIMAPNEKAINSSPREKFSIALLRFCAKLFGVLILAGLLFWAGSSSSGVLQWVCYGAAGVLMVGLLLFGSALSGEVQRKLGPLPIGEPDKDLDSLPLTKEWHERRASNKAAS